MFSIYNSAALHNYMQSYIKSSENEKVLYMILALLLAKAGLNKGI